MHDRSNHGVPRLGAFFEHDSVCVRIWAPDRSALELVRYGAEGQEAATHALASVGDGFFEGRYSVPEGASFLYKLRVDGAGPFPDPWSRSQPFGVHGPSAAVRDDFAWSDAGWRGVPLDQLVIYELHVGTATAEGTFEALIPHLAELRELGVTALELLPLASVPGRWNWGYDGVSWFAPSVNYGGPQGLRRLIDAAHRTGLAVLIDVVYNHLGPDGNYLRVFSDRYFTAKHATNWGDAIDYGEPSGVVRELALANAEMWIRDYHADGLRLDATHAFFDDSSPHILRELGERARAAAPERAVLVTAEDERNDRRLLTPAAEDGDGLEATWVDDFHCQMRRAFAGDSQAHYQDYTGAPEEIARTLRQGWLYEGEISKALGHARGTPCADLWPPRFIHFLQNHDQVGNRPMGNRLGEDISPAAFRAASALLLLSPYTPLLFAGQEWNSKTPFLYFTDHAPELGRMVTEGRLKDFAYYRREAGQEVPDPQASETFLRSKLGAEEKRTPEARAVRAFYRELLALRHAHPALLCRDRASFDARPIGAHALVLERSGGGRRLALVLNIRGALEARLPDGPWRRLLDSEEARFGGAEPAPAEAAALRFDGPRALLFEAL